jgi:hypothetical protein
MGVSRDILLAGLRQLTAKYKGKGADAITVQMVSGVPAYIMHGKTPKPPDGLPGSITVPDSFGHPVAVSVLWSMAQVGIPLVKPSVNPVPPDRGQGLPGSPDRPVTRHPKPDEKDLDAFMWGGASKIDRRDVAVVYKPSMGDPVITQQEIPTAEVTEIQISVDTTGTWGWWTKPFDVQGCLCCTFYGTPVQVVQYTVPQDYMLTLDGWSFFVYGNYFIGETFNVRFSRDGDTLLEYDEVIVDPANPDAAKKCLFSGSVKQVMNEYLRIDRNQVLTITITPKGLFPFNKGPLDPFCGTICCLLHGHMTALLDNRDGAPRPKDVGRLRDDVTGLQCLDEVTEADVHQMLDWLDGATADASEPVAKSADVEHALPTPSSTADVGETVQKPTKTGNAILTGSVLAAIVAASTLSGQEGGGTPLE